MSDWAQFVGLTILIWQLLVVLTAVTINLSPRQLKWPDYARVGAVIDAALVSLGAYLLGLY